MARLQFSLGTFLLVAAAVPLWLFLSAMLGNSPGFGPAGFAIAPLVLAGITAAVHRLVRNYRHAWALSALVAPVLALGFLTAVAWWAR